MAQNSIIPEIVAGMKSGPMGRFSYDSQPWPVAGQVDCVPFVGAGGLASRIGDGRGMATRAPGSRLEQCKSRNA